MKIILFLLCIWCSFNKSNRVTQFDVEALLNARPVTTLTNGKLVTWAKGIDGNGLADGYLTQSAAAFNGDKNAHALPDNPLVPANEKHPEILLHYNNSDEKDYQARFISGAGEFTIPVPENYYTDIYLGLSSAEGPSDLECNLIYVNGKEAKHYILPDYYNNVDGNDSAFTYLCIDLAKWDKQNKMKEKDHHNIHLLKINTDPAQKLTGISIQKGTAGYLVFWSAAGELKYP